MEALRSRENVLITGLAGTGKSYVISQYINEVGKDHTICVAAQGCAARHVGGRTIHSVFALEPRPYSPTEPACIRNIRALADCDLLVIDEIGMVRFDFFEFIIKCVAAAEKRYHRHIQVVAAGDFGQLSPVMTEEEKLVLERMWHRSLEKVRPSVLISNAWEKMNFHIQVLTDCHRQNQNDYIEALSKIYNGSADADILAYFNAKVDPSMQYAEEVLHLCPYRSEAEAINRCITDRHRQDKSYAVFEASKIVGSGVKRAWKSLPVYDGMQVMMIKNAAQYSNGTMGKVRAVDKNTVLVELESGAKVRLKPMKLHDRESYMVQLPFVPAYAVTIHKAQGLTFKTAVIHPGCFEQGQLYTALSRLTSMDGLILARRLRQSDIIVCKESLKCSGSLSA